MHINQQLCLLILFFFFGLTNHAATIDNNIKIEIDVLEERDYINQSSVYGNTSIQYNKYRLFDVISKITEIPLENFIFSKDVSNPNINFKAKSLVLIDKTALIQALKLALKEVFNMDLVLEDIEKNVRVIFCYNTKKLKRCDRQSSFKNSSYAYTMYQSNCVSSQEFVKLIKTWYGKQVINNLNTKDRYDFVIHKANNFEEFVDELRHYYAINIRVEKRNVMCVVLSND